MVDDEAITPVRFAEIIRRIRYKPNWTISTTRGREMLADATVVLFEASVIDAVRARIGQGMHQIPIIKRVAVHDYELGRFRSPSDVVQFVRREIVAAEMHELAEWFAFDGALVTKVHA